MNDFEHEAFCELCRIRANQIESGDDYPKGQDVFLLRKAAEVVERMWAVVRRNPHDPHLAEKMHAEIEVPTDIVSKKDFSLPPQPHFLEALASNTTDGTGTSLSALLNTRMGPTPSPEGSTRTPDTPSPGPCPPQDQEGQSHA